MAENDIITRGDMFLSKAGGGDTQIPTPITREEILLARLAKEAGGGGEYQPKELETPLTTGGETATTVEDALSALNTAKADMTEMSAELNKKQDIITAGRGLSFGTGEDAEKLGHTNLEIQEKVSQSVSKFTIDRFGHVTSYGGDIPFSNTFSKTSPDESFTSAKQLYKWLFAANSFGPTGGAGKGIYSLFELSAGISSTAVSLGGNSVFMIANGMFYVRMILYVNTGQSLALNAGANEIARVKSSQSTLVSNKYRSPLNISAYEGTFPSGVFALLPATTNGNTIISLYANSATTIEPCSVSIAGVFYDDTERTYE